MYSLHGVSINDDALAAIASEMCHPRPKIDKEERQKYAGLGVDQWTKEAIKASERAEIQEMTTGQKASLRQMVVEAAPYVYPVLGSPKDGGSPSPPARVEYDKNFRLKAFHGHPEQSRSMLT